MRRQIQECRALLLMQGGAADQVTYDYGDTPDDRITGRCAARR